MHIENVTVHLTLPDIGGGLLSMLAEAGDAVEKAVSTVKAATTVTPPAIGQPWPGIDGVYAGISRGEGGEPDAHLVLLNAKPERALNWEDAKAWAAGLGDGTRLPTRFESALLYAHLQDQFDTSRWHWTGTQCSSRNAWGQDFDHGSQDDGGKKSEARARAVRRF